VRHKETSSDSDWLSHWKGLNVARGILAILGWLVVALWPSTDRLSSTLLKANDDILQPNTTTVTRNLHATEGNGSLYSSNNT